MMGTDGLFLEARSTVVPRREKHAMALALIVLQI